MDCHVEDSSQRRETYLRFTITPDTIRRPVSFSRQVSGYSPFDVVTRSETTPPFAKGGVISLTSLDNKTPGNPGASKISDSLFCLLLRKTHVFPTPFSPQCVKLTFCPLWSLHSLRTLPFSALEDSLLSATGQLTFSRPLSRLSV